MSTQIAQANFQYNLRLLRTSYELSGEQLSESLSIHEKRVNDLEGGKMPPKLEDLVAITEFFKISFNTLLNERIKLQIH